MSARNKLILSLCILLSLVITVLSVIGYSQLKDYSTEAYRSNLSSKSLLVASALEQKVNNYFTTLNNFTDTLTISSQGEVLIDDDDIDVLVKNRERMGVSNIFVGLPDGTTYAAASKGIIPNFNAKQKQREWFTRAMSGEEHFITKPYMAATGNLSMAMVMPVKHNGQPIAVLGMSLKVKDITDFVNELSTELKLFVAREDGFLIACYYPDLVGENLFTLRPTYQQYAKQPMSAHAYTVPEKGDFYAASSLIKSLGWTVWAFAHSSEINAISNSSVKLNLVVGLLSILASIIWVYFVISRLMYKPIGGEPKEIEKLVSNLANGDLTNIPPLNDKSTGVYRSIILMANNLKSLIADVNQSSQQLLQVSGVIGHSSSKVNASSQSQMQQLEMVATAMNEMTATVSEVAKNAVEASRSTDDANDKSSQGMAIVEEMNQDINNLVNRINAVQQVIAKVQEETENVGGILEVIRGIADQTNLLALNAAIEAARAGEHGRGFSVVADEVRSLAGRVQQSTNEIQGMIEALQSQAEESVQLMAESVQNTECTLKKSNTAHEALAVIETDIQTIKNMNSQIATAAEQQSNVALDINENVVNANDLASKTLGDVQENVATTNELNTMAKQLGDSISIFRV